MKHSSLFRKACPIVAEHVASMPYPVLQSAFDGLVPAGLQHYWKADFVLAEIKTRWNPDNLFHLNQNIKPTVPAQDHTNGRCVI